ncbi:hypothetical protein SAMN05216419_100128 [Nitrosomonas cryotolerans]|uniref:Uncharacterized protein n=1 Tax=Nitrosomonas cryotolerans ATCC 49181 TaxID=1131553 RepID=A0A1N6ISF3_9PROT|nr:hypothetical protein [Nitrosomonas cryotolerans]SFP33347.1 hypothetical protein SAMN05216419_100128 [Nitrosomonas cryotolerans]SIO34939.1 hypothetical protein SAMN02743940_2036 [Nitrosomonas cryotolerans ATCC 49181]
MSNQDQDQKQEQVCTVCDGTKIPKVNLQDLNENKQIMFPAIDCKHCKGTGKEPN